MNNSFGKKKDGELKALVATATAVLSQGGGDYGVSPTMVGSLSAAGIDLERGMSAQTAAVAAEKAATQQKLASKAATVASLNAIAGIVYHRSDVSDEMLAAIGFAPRRSVVPRPLAALPVTELLAQPYADGSVKLSWKRGSGNPYGTMFLIESSEDGAAWTILGSTKRASATVEGYAPGVTAWFRITATTSTSATRPSAAVAIYGPTAATLRVVEGDRQAA